MEEARNFGEELTKKVDYRTKEERKFGVSVLWELIEDFATDEEDKELVDEIFEDILNRVE